MNMTYEEAMQYIHGTLKFGSKLGLHNIGRLLELMENPHKKLKFIHVAGTNGKGSTVAMISSILVEAGFKTGIFTSPYLQRFSERIRIGNEEIGREDLARITAFVREKVEIMLQQGENHPTEFEIITAVALQYYMERRCDVVVLEVGLGGRFDSTNIIDTPEVAVVTTISYDHMDRLGDTLPAIAFEKAGIIKPGGDVVLYPQGAEVEEVFEKACTERGARLHKASFDQLRVHKADASGQVFDAGRYSRLEIVLLGEHQVRNAAVAVRAVELLGQKGYAISEESIRKGLKNARWAGRLEVLYQDPYFLIDGAHNIEGAKALRAALDAYFPDKKRIFIVGVLRDKDYMAMLDAVLPGCERVIAVTPGSERALPAVELARAAEAYCKNIQISDTIEEAVRTSMGTAARDEVVCAFGSLYYIGEVRDAFGQ